MPGNLRDIHLDVDLPARSLGPRRRSASRGRRGSQESLGSKSRRGQEVSQERRRRTQASQESLTSSRQSPRQGRRRSRQEGGEERREAEVEKQRRSRRRSVSRDSLVEPGPRVENEGQRGYSQQHENGQQRKAREERSRAQSKEELRESRGGRRVVDEEEHVSGVKQRGWRGDEDEGQAAAAGGAKQSLAGEFIDFYLGRARK